VLVFGGRGEPARAKRADLGRVAGEADLVVLTGDSWELLAERVSRRGGAPVLQRTG